MKELNSKSVKKKITDNLIRDSYFKDGERVSMQELMNKSTKEITLDNLAKDAYGENIAVYYEGMLRIVYRGTKSFTILKDYYARGLSVQEIAIKRRVKEDKIRIMISELINKLREPQNKVIATGEYLRGPITVNSVIERLEIGRDLRHRLEGRGLKTIGDLLNTTEDYILSIEGIGPAKLNQIKTALRNVGF